MSEYFDNCDIALSIEQIEENELRAERHRQRRYDQHVTAHPDCRDPDHPGCEQCMENEDE